MQVYFARSLTGGRTEGDTAIYEAIKKTVRNNGHTLAMDTDPGIKRSQYADTQMYIHNRDLIWVDRSDVMIIESSNPSSGVGYEVAYAWYQRGIPMIVVAKQGTYVSAMYANLEKRFYNTLDELIEIVEEFLEKHE